MVITRAIIKDVIIAKVHTVTPSRDHRRDNQPSYPRYGYGNNFPRDPGNNFPRNQAFSRHNQPHCQICKKPGHTVDRCRFCYARDNRTSDDRSTLAQSFVGLHLSSHASSDSIVDHIEPHWLADSGATSYMTSNPAFLCQFSPYTGNDGVYVGNGNSLHISRVGYSHGEDTLGGSRSYGILPTPSTTSPVSLPLVVPPTLICGSPTPLQSSLTTTMPELGATTPTSPFV
ncbi:hypothetical protein F0562_024346 [Nyssa sinensis]|uniref:Retrovirus-related Pol polyprotein from transposon TNT 1-94-like beta-barrel domain-containing protein n=1 Tax=Nyssa sinensis TaxID=561372 RepID=A0A5J5BC09_9ASTE|nr:hypothetical protein F0562_024346 [Nyssa sinensis]